MRVLVSRREPSDLATRLTLSRPQPPAVSGPGPAISLPRPRSSKRVAGGENRAGAVAALQRRAGSSGGGPAKAVGQPQDPEESPGWPELPPDPAPSSPAAFLELSVTVPPEGAPSGQAQIFPAQSIRKWPLAGYEDSRSPPPRDQAPAPGPGDEPWTPAQRWRLKSGAPGGGREHSPHRLSLRL